MTTTHNPCRRRPVAVVLAAVALLDVCVLSARCSAMQTELDRMARWR